MQKTVSLYPAKGLPGQEVNVHTAVYTPFNYISDGTVAAGSFAFAGTNSDDGEGVVYPLASGKGTGSVIGLVERTFTGSFYPTEDNPDGTLTYRKGHEVTIAIRGDYYVAATAAATVGQSVLCNPTPTASCRPAIERSSFLGIQILLMRPPIEPIQPFSKGKYTANFKSEQGSRVFFADSSLF